LQAADVSGERERERSYKDLIAHHGWKLSGVVIIKNDDLVQLTLHANHLFEGCFTPVFTKNELSRSRISTVIAREADRQPINYISRYYAGGRKEECDYNAK